MGKLQHSPDLYIFPARKAGARSMPESHPAHPEVTLLARSLTDGGVAPAAVLAVGARGRGGFRFAVGAAGVRSAARPEPVTPHTPFDLASVTKPFVACTFARLVRQGLLGWQEPLDEILPEV